MDYLQFIFGTTHSTEPNKKVKLLQRIQQDVNLLEAF